MQPFAVQVTTVGPIGEFEPDGGLHVTVTVVHTLATVGAG
jgi:hypothetical protein